MPRHRTTLFDPPVERALSLPPGRSCAEFFAGIGLVRIGLERSGWHVAFANDIDEQKARQYEGHFGPAPYYHVGDIHDLAHSPEEVPDVVLAHASFPCTDLSLAGARRGIYEGESSAFWGFHALLRAKGEARPPLVLLENVTGFLTSNGGEDFHHAMIAMNDLGYAVDPILVDAAHFVPQSRPRLFVVCKRDIASGVVETTDTHEPTPLRSQLLLDAIRRFQDVHWEIAVLPELPPYGRMRLEEVLDRTPDNSPEWWSSERADYLFNQMSERHREVAEAMMSRRKWSYGTVFRRVRNGRSMAELRTDGLAGCLRTPKGGSGRQILFKAGYGRYQVRLLNASECARLMGAPEFRVTAPLNTALFGFGDAVCADAVDWIARNYLNRIANVLGGSEAASGRIGAR